MSFWDTIKQGAGMIPGVGQAINMGSNVGDAMGGGETANATYNKFSYDPAFGTISGDQNEDNNRQKWYENEGLKQLDRNTGGLANNYLTDAQGMYASAARGEQPSVAQQMQQQAFAQNNNAIRSAAAGARGPGGLAMGQMNAQAQMGQNNMQAAAQGGLLRAQEMEQARQGMFNTGNAMAGNVMQGHALDTRNAQGFLGQSDNIRSQGADRRLGLLDRQAAENARGDSIQNANSQYNAGVKNQNTANNQAMIGTALASVPGAAGAVAPAISGPTGAQGGRSGTINEKTGKADWDKKQ